MWTSILSSLMSAIAASILSAFRKRRQDEERIDDVRVRAKLEVENEALKKAEEARNRADSVPDPTHDSVLKRLRKGSF